MQHLIDHLANDVYQDVERKIRNAVTECEEADAQEELDALEETISILHAQLESIESNNIKEAA